MKIVLTNKQRETASKILQNAGIVVLATLVLGNIVSGRPLKIGAFIVGTIIFITCVVYAIIIDKGD